MTRRLAVLCALMLALSGFSPGTHRHPAIFGGSQVVTGTSCTVAFDSSSTPILATVNTAINAATDGQVVCLARGSLWTATTGLSLATSHANSNRVLVCASTGATCTASGAANPQITVTGNNAGMNFTGSSAGYTIQNINFLSTLACSAGTCTASGIGLGGHSNINLEGCKIDGWYIAAYFATSPPGNNLKFGVCGNPVEVTGNPGNRGDLRAGVYGSCTNCGISVYFHDWHGYDTTSESHMVDMSTDGSPAWNGAGHDLTFECSHIVYNGGLVGSYVKINRGFNITIRDNLWENLSGGTANGFGLALDNHAAAGTEGISGAAIYRNRFYMGVGGGAIENDIAQNTDIYDNVATLNQGTGASDVGQRGFYQTWYSTGASDDLQIVNDRLFNNTVYRTGRSYNDPVNGLTGWPIIGSNGGAIAPGRVTCTNCAAFQNLLIELDDVDAKVWGAKGGCNEYGANGGNLTDNFVYTPGDASPVIWGGCSAAARNSNQSPHAAGFNIDPLLVNVGASDFHLVSSSSTPYKFSNAASGPATDYDQHAQTSPNTAGAFANIP